MARSKDKKATGLWGLVASLLLIGAGVWCILEDLVGLGGLMIAGGLLVFGMCFVKGHRVVQD
jgi:hypothetical protein